MNYRHAFHAGNFADVMKHALLVRILAYLQRKETPLRVIDTHAGIGFYDLTGDEAERTGEWIDGIGRLDQAFSPEVEELLAPYRTVIADVRTRHGQTIYPGSPGILRELLRRQDRGVFVELHPADHAVLSGAFNTVANLKVMHLDGWTALHALIPPKERRGLVLIDPPYEKPNELERLGTELLEALAKWPTGVYAGWYPIKALEPVDAVAARLHAESPRPGLRLELLVDDPRDPSRLNGSGLFVLNPPWALREEAEILLPALAERLSRSGYGGYRCESFGPSA
ncbi:23S rRNA (adenine(2030)-N(6))-methyltransferase RlmJ [Microvirga aerophila]|jgi:23S rRNA (adenine2030-N6)-methyltransferase|uniref:Ribosomal RNA large subunit methyltransferase J n=1 Tax=Microvirga aerophila TaxID=670291 RepID=A0A512C1S0_9HYPH|nr:23S rRNA (adenine(2030)-N(6))-methyltransferase RlmJ [Microvirga aerophila]GEO18166.1 ribosomal RNA large subunit methyltransferase J [Microvirga aerophila]